MLASRPANGADEPPRESTLNGVRSNGRRPGVGGRWWGAEGSFASDGCSIPSAILGVERR